MPVNGKAGPAISGTIDSWPAHPIPTYMISEHICDKRLDPDTTRPLFRPCQTILPCQSIPHQPLPPRKPRLFQLSRLRSLPAGFLIPILVFFLLFHPDTSNAQDFEEWLRQEQRQFEDYRAEQNRAFAEMLKEQWEAMYSNAPDSQLEEEKPTVIPVAEPKAEPEVEPEPESLPPPVPHPDPAPQSEPPPSAPEPKPQTEKRQRPQPHSPPSPPVTTPTTHPSQPSIPVTFFGLPLDVPCDPALSQISAGNTFNAETIASVWEDMSRTEIEPAIDYYRDIKDRMRMNDWGLARIVFSTGQAIYNDDRNMARLYTWFMLIQTGYRARVGFNDDGVILLLATDTHLFGTPFFRFGEDPFFMVHFDRIEPQPARIFTYRSDFPADLAPLSLRLPGTPGFQPDYLSRELGFTFQGKEIRLTVDVDRNLVSFYEFFPQTELEVYFDAPVTPATASGLIDALEPHLEDLSETDAVHLLLRFVQTAFGYKIDPDNFGREKPLFPEETLYYDYSDCEDRAILFRFLVRELTGLDVVGLRYPGHIATAVRFNEPLDGDTVDVDGRTYHVCDPTYIHAAPGMAMSSFKNTQPVIISIER